VGAGRLLLVPGDANDLPHIGRVAVLAPYRGQGVGRALMAALHELAREQGYRGATLAAQTHALGFYRKLGYVARGEVYFEAGIEHQDMDLLFEG
jgi:predicted GNAT family N-acyltransferase